MSDQQNTILFKNMRSMISLIDKLRDFHLQDYISLPRIAVLGEQSAGKSSLLETIAGLNFLPRGSGIVTRRPLELRMIRSSIEKPYFIFPKEKGQTKFFDPKEITKVIQELTDKVAGDDKGISKDPITCTVYSPSVPDLTLIDLPGITKNPVKGQPKDIEAITKGLVKHYCSNPDTLILCVIPANIDLANSDALKYAGQLDPNGERTIGVLTKIDLMDEGASAKDILMNNLIKLKYGYVGIKGRSQADVNNNMSVEDSIKKEQDFFGKHPIYSTLPTEVLGTRSLVDRVSSLLYKLIEKGLPRIKKEIIERKKKAKEQLVRLGESFPESEEKKLELVFKLVREFKDNYTQGINGKYHHKHDIQKISRSEETMIYKLNQLFQELYEEFSKKDFRVSNCYTDEFITNAIRTYQSVSIPGFHSFDSFLYLMHPQIDKLKEPILHLLDECKIILEDKGVQIIDKLFKKFHSLHQEVKETFLKELAARKHSVQKILENLIQCEDNYLFTNDPTFLSHETIKVTKKEINTTDLLTMELRQKIDSYFFITVRNLRDIVPKLIGQFLVKMFNKSIEMKILNSLNKQDYCLDSLNENKSQAQLRKKLKKEMDSLMKAESLLINDFNMGFCMEIVSVPQKNKEISFDDEEDVEEYLQNLEQINDSFLDFNQQLLNGTDINSQNQLRSNRQVENNLQRNSNSQKIVKNNNQRNTGRVNNFNQPVHKQPMRNNVLNNTQQRSSKNNNTNQTTNIQRPVQQITQQRPNPIKQTNPRSSQIPTKRPIQTQTRPKPINFNKPSQPQNPPSNNRDPFDFNFLPNSRNNNPKNTNRTTNNTNITTNNKNNTKNTNNTNRKNNNTRPVNNLFGE